MNVEIQKDTIQLAIHNLTGVNLRSFQHRSTDDGRAFALVMEVMRLRAELEMTKAELARLESRTHRNSPAA